MRHWSRWRFDKVRLATALSLVFLGLLALMVVAIYKIWTAPDWDLTERTAATALLAILIGGLTIYLTNED